VSRDHYLRRNVVTAGRATRWLMKPLARGFSEDGYRKPSAATAMQRKQFLPYLYDVFIEMSY
jgi:hypothetical protein